MAPRAGVIQFPAFPPILPIGAKQFGGLVKKPSLSLLGEAGPELVLPLTKPARMKYLLAKYLPMYAPQMTAQYGGLYTPNEPVTIAGGDTYRIEGPIYIEHVTDVEDFLGQLKYKARAAGT